MTPALGDWIASASKSELAEALEVLAHELRQRVGTQGTKDPEPPATEQLRLLTAKEVAEYTSLPIGRVYDLARRGKIAGVVPFGERQYRFEPTALKAWVTDRPQRT